MKQYEIDCFEVVESDGGGQSEKHVAYVGNKALADLLVARQKGYRRVTTYKKLITIFDTAEEVEANSSANLRKSAIAKLSAAECAALGIST